MKKNYTIRRVKLPIQMKLISIITLMLVVSLSIYLFFALDLFHQDKSAYIYETGLNTSGSVSTQLSSYLDDALNDLNFLGNSYNSTGKNDQIITELFNSRNTAIEFSIYSTKSSVPKQVFGIFDKTYLKGHELPKNYLSSFKSDVGDFYKNRNISNLKIAILSNELKIPILQINVFNEGLGQVWHAAIDLSSIVDIFKKNKIYDISVFYNSGELFLHEFGYENLVELSNVAKEAIAGSKEITLEGGRRILVSSSPIPKFGLNVLAQIDYDKAFLVATQLIEKSIYFGLLLISVFCILGVVFSKSITSSIERLFLGTTKMSEGAFDTKVEIKSNDEIGALADSFNYMSGEIVRYMSKMEEKLRLENELQVAKLVQASFFPERNISLPGIDLSAFYAHASECGGDWWGHFNHGDKTVIMVADATGHGVPAALLTATANCCMSNIRLMGESDPMLLSSPASMLSIFNRAVCDAGSKILMSFFIGIIDKEEKIISYANASHNVPLIYRSAETSSKENFESLLCDPGPHLGKETKAQYSVNKISYSTGDILFLFTDGIIEEVNIEGKPWGNRKFLKSILTHIGNSPEAIVEGVVNDVFSYSNTNTPSDDITFIAAKMG